MKALVISSLILFNMSAMAASKDLYSVINVEEIDSSIPGKEVRTKAIGGLDCTRVTIVMPEAVPSYHCSIDSEKLNAEAIYNSLQVSEIDQSIPGQSVSVKSAGELTCSAKRIVMPGTKIKYGCNVTF